MAATLVAWLRNSRMIAPILLDRPIRGVTFQA
jgi:hypothetical protein